MRDTRLSIDLINAQADIIAAWMADGRMDFYDGERPDWPEDEPAGNLIGSAKFRDPACMGAVEGMMVSFPAESGICYRAGRVAWARLRRANGDAIMDLSVGVSNANVDINVIDWTPAMEFSAITMTHIVEKASHDR